MNKHLLLYSGIQPSEHFILTDSFSCDRCKDKAKIAISISKESSKQFIWFICDKCNIRHIIHILEPYQTVSIELLKLIIQDQFDLALKSLKIHTK